VAPIDLNEIIDTAACARWVGLSVVEFRVKVRAGRIPSIRLNRRVWRFHRGSVLAALTKGGRA
jgi:hypothetical protein